MKRIKLNLALLAMLIGATAAFAFKAPVEKKSSKFALVWYDYNGGLITSPSSYTKDPNNNPDCNGNGSLCAIQGPDNGAHPSPATVAAPTATRDFD